MNEKHQQSKSLLSFYDDFADFNDDCAFLCDAFACLVNNHECLDERSIRGLERNATLLKQRVNHFNNRLKEIREEGIEAIRSEKA